MKHRIVEVIENGTTQYQVQEKKFFLFWVTQTFGDYCIDGLGGQYPYSFDTIEEAKKYIANSATSKRIIETETKEMPHNLRKL